MFYALAMNEAEIADMVSVFVALAPVTTINEQPDFILDLFRRNVEAIMYVSKLLGVYDIFQPLSTSRVLCGFIPDLCKLGGMLSDTDLDVNDIDRTAVFFSKMPAGASIQSFEHFSQIHSAKKFQTFDYGPAKNKQFYGQEDPLDIPVHKISKVPIGMFVGQYDKMASLIDSREAHARMKQAVKFYKEYPLGHLAFLVAKDMSYFTEDVVSFIKEHHPTNKHHMVLEDT
jgi:hypothetical protein